MSYFQEALKAFVNEEFGYPAVVSLELVSTDAHAEYFSVEVTDPDKEHSFSEEYKVTFGDGDVIERGRVYSRPPRTEDWVYEGDLTEFLEVEKAAR